MAPRIKKEKEKEKGKASCIAALTPQALAMRAKRKIEEVQKDHPWLVDYYNKHVKKSRTQSNDTKQEFLEHLLSCTDISSSPFFMRIHEDIGEKEDANKAKWLSWTVLLGKEPEEVLRLSIKQGKIQTRPSELLNHDDPETASLAAEYKLQYRYAIDHETDRWIERSVLQKSDDTKPVDQEQKELDEKTKELIKQHEAGCKALRMFRMQEDDMQGRVNALAANK